MKIPKAFLTSKRRKEMWADASKIIKKLDRVFGFSEIYVVGSFGSKKKRPADIDLSVVMKGIRNNNAWPIDLVIVPNTNDTEFYLGDIKKWMKKRYGKKCGPIRIK